MGWLSRLAGFSENLKLDVLMKFDIESGQGIAALRWIPIQPHTSLSDEQSKIALVTMLYARTLINQKETRDDLFRYVEQAARRVLQGGGKLTYEPWAIHVAGKYLSIWPWVVTEPGHITDAKTYTATLKSTVRGSLGIDLKMAFGQERILVPSSALIAVSGLATELGDTQRARLAGVLLGVNTHYRSSGKISLGSEKAALEAAMPTLTQSP